MNLRASTHPEFDAWRWSDYWIPLEEVIEFKRAVYKEALEELSLLLFQPRQFRHSQHRACNPASLISHETDPKDVK